MEEDADGRGVEIMMRDDSGSGPMPAMDVFMQKRQEDSWIAHGVTVGAIDLSYSVLVGRRRSLLSCKPPERKAILKRLTLGIGPGLTYLMGPSGAGKTTLLDVLAGRVRSGFMSGHVLFNGKPRHETFFEKSAYVRQDDVQIPHLTVDETIRYAARLRIGDDYTDTEREARISSVVSMLGLEACRFSLVGDAHVRGISGGEKKRLSMAVEILHMPSLIFLDEPTSGLDSLRSYEVMSFARNLARQKRTILATIHQPSAETFALSGYVVALKSGRLAYCGPTSAIVGYLTSAPLGFDDRDFCNPADFMLAAVSGVIESNAGTRSSSQFDRLFRQSVFFATPDFDPEGAKLEALPRRPARFATSTATQTRILLERFWVTQNRQPAFIAAMIIRNVVIAVVSAAMFWGMGLPPKDAAFSSTFTRSSYNVASLLYFGILYSTICVMQIVPQLFFYKVLYTREREAAEYGTVAFWLSQAVVNVPLLLLTHVVFVEIAYWTIGLAPDAGAHFYMILSTFLNHLASVALAQALAARAPIQEVALSLFPLLFLAMSSFTGFTVPLHQLPKGWQWASYACCIRWCYEGVLVNEFRFRPDYRATMAFFGLKPGHRWMSIAILVGFLLFFNTLVLVGLRPRPSALVVEALPNEGAAVGGVANKDTKHGEHSVNVELTHAQTSSKILSRDMAISKRARGEGTGLLFHELTYSVRPFVGKAKRILEGVSGRVDPGNMCAIMGGSGCGKSTLLDVLAMRKTGGEQTGVNLVGGRGGERPRGWNSYVTQDNVHIAQFTVRETLYFAAELRLAESMGARERQERANEVMAMLGLEEAADVMVGNAAKKGISGGQARRLTIGVEILHLPDVIFLDEPVTGLDSVMSYEMMSLLRNIADSNRTLVCTVHAPAERVFGLFDSLILLAKGRQTYFGPVREAVGYFSQPAIGWTMEQGRNPADFLMEASAGMPTRAEGARRSVDSLSEVLKQHGNFKDVATAVADATKAPSKNGSKTPASMPTQKYPRSFLSQARILAHRQLVKLSKMRLSLNYVFFRSIAVGLFHGTLYWRLAPGAMQPRFSLLCFASMFVMVMNESFFPEMYADRLLMYRERGAGVYGSLSYWVSSLAPFMPQSILGTVVYCAVLYPMAGLQPGWGRFGYFTLNMLLSSLCGLCFAQLVAFLVPSATISVAIFPSAVFVLVSFCGFVMALPTIPVYLKWGAVSSFARWTYQGLIINEFQGNTRLLFNGFGVTNVPYSDFAYGIFINLLGMGGYSKWASLPILTYTGLAMFVFNYLPIRYVSFERR